MTTHKERISAISRKGFSLPRSYYRNSQNDMTNTYNHEKERPLHRSNTEREHSDKDSVYQEPYSAIYQNARSDQVKFEFDEVDNSKRLTDSKPTLTYSQPNLGKNKTYTASRGYITMQSPATRASNPVLYKSQSLSALKSKEPTKTLAKSTIQQEYHDKRVQRHFRNVAQGPAKRPCMIATILIAIFALLFIVGLTLICLTYIYKNINFSLDKGEMIGPVIMAGSFIFLGVGIKFVYDAHKIVRKNQKTLTYRGYDKRYVGLQNGSHGATIGHEKLVSGTTTDVGLARVPNRKLAASANVRTLGLSSQKLQSNGH